jgi:FkbM family methyltransferase
MNETDIYNVKFSFIPIEFKVNLANDGYGLRFWQNVSSGNYELDIFSLISKYATNRNVFVDVGAANGALSIFAAKLGYEVISIEPNRDVFQVLESNINLNKEIENRIQLRNAILVSREDLGNVSDAFKKGLLTEITRSGSSKSAFTDSELIDIASVLRSHDKSRFLMKLDIEGAEWRLFKCSSFLKTTRIHDVIMIVALHPGLNRPLEIILKKRRLMFFPRKSFWRVLVIKDVIQFYFRIRNFNLYRTNGVMVSNVFDFIALVVGGCHEYVIVPNTSRN